MIGLGSHFASSNMEFKIVLLSILGTWFQSHKTEPCHNAKFYHSQLVLYYNNGYTTLSTNYLSAIQHHQIAVVRYSQHYANFYTIWQLSIIYVLPISVFLIHGRRGLYRNHIMIILFTYTCPSPLSIILLTNYY